MRALSTQLEHEMKAAALELEGELMRARGLSADTAAFAEAAEQMDAIGQIQDAWRSLPPDVKQDIQRRGAQLWQLRGAYFARFVAAVNALVFQNPAAVAQALQRNRNATIQDLALRAGQLARLPRRNSFSRPGFSGVQVREHQRRQRARGRVPGRDPRMKRYRELELELEMAAARLSDGL